MNPTIPTKTTGNNADTMSGTMTVWDHLEALRSVVIRALIVLAIAAAVMFAFMPEIFDAVILAPCRSDGHTTIELVNIELASQFFIHMSLSCWLALVVSCPVVLYLLWSFVRPGLYPAERRATVTAFGTGALLFYSGVATGYFVVFPIILDFLADYQLSPDVPNIISLQSYMDSFISIVMMMGLLFELPIVTWLLGRAGIMKRSFFNRYRRHAIIALLLVAAIITPTGDPLTLSIVFAPLYLLWEISAAFVPRD